MSTQPKPKRRRRRGRRNAGGITRHMDWVGGIIDSGNTAAWTGKTFNLPADRSFRLLSLQCQFALEDGASGTLQLRAFEPYNNSNSCWSSGPLIVGRIPVRRNMRLPGAALLWHAQLGNYLVSLDTICQIKGGDNFKVRYVVRAEFELGRESFPSACPSKLSFGSVTQLQHCGHTYCCNATRVLPGSSGSIGVPRGPSAGNAEPCSPLGALGSAGQTTSGGVITPHPCDRESEAEDSLSSSFTSLRLELPV